MRIRKSKLNVYLVARPNCNPKEAVVIASDAHEAVRLSHKTYGHAIDISARRVSMKVPQVLTKKNSLGW